MDSLFIDISSQQGGEELLETANNSETSVKEIETSFILTRQTNEETQTNMTKREIDGIMQAMTSVKEEIANELAKLSETNKDLVKLFYSAFVFWWSFTAATTTSKCINNNTNNHSKSN
jgi:ribosomal protein S24E